MAPLVLFLMASARAATHSGIPHGAPQPEWQDWLQNFGHDTYAYPSWVVQQMNRCECRSSTQVTDVGLVSSSSVCSEQDVVTLEWRNVEIDYTESTKAITFCSAKKWLLDHMPEFDKHFMPPSVTVGSGVSMFDDNIAFTLMALNASKFASDLPLWHRLHYILPYASYHESRANWRPLFFAKFFNLASNAKSTVEAMSHLVAPNTIMNWTDHTWPSDNDHHQNYQIFWGSSTAPPVLSPHDFLAYGYGSCSAWATFVTYAARAVGIPARQVGTPCWNADEFAGLAIDNPNVTRCWTGGAKTSSPGGRALFNHNWVEYWDDVQHRWVYVNVPPSTSIPNEGLCSFNASTGCDYDPIDKCTKAHKKEGPSAASRDHEIFAVTWAQDNIDGTSALDGGQIVDVNGLNLSDGTAASPLVWSPFLASPLGVPLKNIGLRVVNRTDTYRCHEPTS